MEGSKRSHLLFLLLPLLHVCTTTEANCPSLPDKGLTCHNDYDHVITCVWNSTFVSEHADAACTLYAERVDTSNGYHNSCNLEPVDVSRPAIQTCSVVFKSKWRFLSNHVLNISVSCNPVKHSLSISYQPSCHIKLNPPPKPEINSTTVSWNPQVTEMRLDDFCTQLQWKRHDQSWSDPSVQKSMIKKQCEWSCTAQINAGGGYEARVRVKTSSAEFNSIWSDWSPIASWETPTEPSPLDVTRGVLGTLACVVLFALLLVLFRTDKTTWIYITKTIRGAPVPNPGKSSVNFQNWLSPYFTSESIHSFLRPVEIISVEVTSAVDAVAPRGPEAALQEKMKSESGYDTTSSNFSNPSYSQMSPPPPPLPPVSSLTAGNLEACRTDTPYGPVGGHGEGRSTEQVEDEVRAKEEALLQLLSKRSNNSESMLVISDYEKAEKPQMERPRLQSLDSGVCSGEEVSQESLEADSINVTDGQDGPEGRGEREGGNGKEVSFHKLFGGVFDKGSIHVCSGYEQVQTLQADGAELPSLDSGMCSGSEEQLSQEESLEDAEKSTESTSLLFPPPSPPPPCSALACSSPSFTPLPLNFCTAGLSPLLMSAIRSVEPSGDGYMPVRQEQS